jgi:dolichyl-phosphate beta-glucosyltransferase
VSTVSRSDPPGSELETASSAEPAPLSEGLSLSIVIPAYNEAQRIGRTLERIHDYALRTQQRTEILVVDDGSQDGTASVVRQFAARTRSVRLLVNPVHHGKGYSVRQGMLAATGDLVLMCDADLSAPIEQVEKLRPWLDRGFDVVIGSRDLPDSVVEPPPPKLRRLLATIFRSIRRLLLLRQIRDTQCGFKLFRQRAARETFARQKTSGWLFDCEVLAIAQRLGFRIREVGIVWHHDPDSRFKPSHEIWTALPTLLAIRLRVGRIRC